MQVFSRVLREELNLISGQLNIQEVETEPDAIAGGLVLALQQADPDCLVINQALQGAMFRCFDAGDEKSEYEKTQGDLKAIERGLDKILGYFVLSLVNPDDVRVLDNWLGDGALSNYYFELHVRTLGGVELFIAHEQNRPANIDLDSRGQKLEGKHLIFTKTTPFQWSDKAKLQDTQLEIWNIINHDEGRTEPLDSDELEELQAIVKQRAARRRDQENYCLVLEFEEKADDVYTKQCAAFLEKLKIPMVRYKVPGKDKPFYGHEKTLMAAVADFLKYFSEYRNS